MSLSVSTSRLSNWTTTRSTIVARSSGAISMSGAAVTSIPPEWIERWRGKPSMRAQNSSQRSQSLIPTVLPPRGWGGGSGSIRATEESPPARRRIPARRPAQLVGRPRRRFQLAALRVHAPAVDERRWHQPVPIRLVAGPSTGAQPGDARRRVARPALVVRRPATATRRPRRERVVAEPGERPWSSRIVRRRRLLPGRDLADERDTLLQLAHPIDQAVGLGTLGREDLGRRSVPRPPEELGESAIRFEVAADHDRVVRLERLGHPIHQRAREPERVAHLPDRGPRPVRDEVADHPRVLRPIAAGRRTG